MRWSVCCKSVTLNNTNRTSHVNQVFNDYVKEFHTQDKNAFIFWLAVNINKQDNMCSMRVRFNHAFRQYTYLEDIAYAECWYYGKIIENVTKFWDHLKGAYEIVITLTWYKGGGGELLQLCGKIIFRIYLTQLNILLTNSMLFSGYTKGFKIR